MAVLSAKNHILFPLLPNASPFLLEHPQSEAIVVCFHGFGATPFEIRPVAQKIYELGINVSAILFPGHGIAENNLAKKEMGNNKLDDWLVAARNEIIIARQRYRQVFVYGQSMGGAIALIMASEGIVDACATTAPAIRLTRGVGIFRLLGKLNFNIKKPKIKLAYTHEVYDFWNSRSLRALHQLSIQSRKNLSHIHCPVYVAHSKQDKTVDPIIVKWLENKIKSSLKIDWYEKSGHTMPLDCEQESVCSNIANFFKKFVEI